MVKKFLVWIIKRYQLQTVINELQNELSVKDCNSKVVNEDSTFYPEASVQNLQNNKDKIRIGKGTHIRGGLLIFNYGGEIIIGNNCYIGDHSRIWSGEKVVIGNFVQVSHNVNIIDTTAHEMDAQLRAERYVDLINNGPWKNKGSVVTSPVMIGDYAWLSFNVSILRGVVIGEGAIIGANSVVTNDIPPYTLAVGNPAKVIKKLKIFEG